MAVGQWKSKLQWMDEIIWLVVGPPLWKIWKSIGMIIPNMWENKKWQPNHQPVMKFLHNGHSFLRHKPPHWIGSFISLVFHGKISSPETMGSMGFMGIHFPMEIWGKIPGFPRARRHAATWREGTVSSWIPPLTMASRWGRNHRNQACGYETC